MLSDCEACEYVHLECTEYEGRPVFNRYCYQAPQYISLFNSPEARKAGSLIMECACFQEVDDLQAQKAVLLRLKTQKVFQGFLKWIESIGGKEVCRFKDGYDHPLLIFLSQNIPVCFRCSNINIEADDENGEELELFGTKEKECPPGVEPLAKLAPWLPHFLEYCSNVEEGSIHTGNDLLKVIGVCKTIVGSKD
jgi:hypothetical protein